MKKGFVHSLSIAMTSVLLVSLMLAFSSCEDSEKKGKAFDDKVVIRFASDPSGVHPHNTTGAYATEIKRLMHLRLLEIDHKTLELTPFLAKDLPIIEKVNDGKGLEITYELRDEATWDDGKPITVDDVEFSIKAVKNPKVNAANLRPYLEFITEIRRYPDNPQKFTFVCNKVYILAEHVSGSETIIIPKHIYDPNGLSDKISFAQIVEGKASVMDSPENMAFAQAYNDTKLNREPEMAIGGGAYRLKSWTTGQRLILERKEDWWGDKLKGTNMFFDPGPAKVVFEIVNDVTTAITAMKSGKLDLLATIPMKDWLELPKKSKKYTQNFNRSEIPSIGYTYMGYNLKNPKLSDKKVRYAIDHLVDIEELIDQLNYGVSIPISHGILPAMGKHIYKEIPRRKYDVKKAQALLAEAGWADENGNGVLDKRIDGKLTELELSISYPSGNDTGKNWVLAFQEAFKSSGVKVTANPLDWSVMLERLKSHSLEIWLGAWVMDPRPSDPKQIWHTESYNGGSNYSGFGNEDTDKLIEEIGLAVTKEEQTRLYHKWQDIQFEEAPALFLWRGKHRISSHKRFGDIKPTERNPGYHPGHFLPATGFAQPSPG